MMKLIFTSVFYYPLVIMYYIFIKDFDISINILISNIYYSLQYFYKITKNKNLYILYNITYKNYNLKRFSIILEGYLSYIKDIIYR